MQNTIEIDRYELATLRELLAWGNNKATGNTVSLRMDQIDSFLREAELNRDDFEEVWEKISESSQYRENYYWPEMREIVEHYLLGSWERPKS